MAVTYSTELEQQVRQWAETMVAPKRLPHVRGVVKTADRFAVQYAPADGPRARLAAWIHDAAKAWDDDALLAYAESHALPIAPVERLVPMLLHGAVSYDLARHRFGLDDPDLRQACALHTTGGPNMCVTAKIVFLADLLEPTRDFDGVDKLRATAQRDLDTGVLHAAAHTLKHLIERQRIIDPRLVDLHNELVRAGVRYPSG